MPLHRLFVAALFVLPLTAHAEGEYEAAYRKIETPVLQSDDLKGTVITPSLEAKIDPRKNLIYAAACQLAWNELMDKFVKGGLLMQDAPDYVASLNKRMYTKERLAPDSFIAFADYATPDNIASLQNALEDKFGFADPDISAPGGKDDILLYAYLAKGIEFANPFQGDCSIAFRSPAGTAKVSAFGYDLDEYSFFKLIHDQVKIDYYDPNTGECVIRLTGTSPDDEIILALLPPGKTLIETIQRAQSRLQDGPGEFFSSCDKLVAPKVIFKIRHEYRELCNKIILNFKNGPEYYYFKNALQFTDFRLDEKGAALKVKVIMSMKTTGGGFQVEPKIMIFNRPFLLLLKEKSAPLPYFAAWIANPELLIPYTPQPEPSPSGK
jgi:hypothetical protein